MAAELKTKPTRKSVRKFIGSVENVRRQTDAMVLLDLFEEITGKSAVLWGESIVGFGQYKYHYPSGQKGIWPVTGFSPRKQNLSIYIMPGFSQYRPLLDKLGKHKHSVSCLYINKLADVDMNVLRELIVASIAEMETLYPDL